MESHSMECISLLIIPYTLTYRKYIGRTIVVWFCRPSVFKFLKDYTDLTRDLVFTKRYFNNSPFSNIDRGEKFKDKTTREGTLRGVLTERELIHPWVRL